MRPIGRTGFLLLLALVLGLGGIVVIKLLVEGNTGRALGLAVMLAVGAVFIWIHRVSTIGRERRAKGEPPPDPH